jgi:mRNA-degrading endonuclease HigB of HigAB toxin-antitoxin module
MRVIGRENIQGLSEDLDSRRWVRHWLAELMQAHWKRPSDVLQQFPRCKQHEGNRFEFPISNGRQAIATVFHFPLGIAFVHGITIVSRHE